MVEIIECQRWEGFRIEATTTFRTVQVPSGCWRWLTNNLGRAQEVFATAVKHRPRIRLTIRQRTRVLQRSPQQLGQVVAMRETRRRTSGLPGLSNRRRSGLSIWSYTLRNAGAILLVSVPAIIIMSHASGCHVSVSCWPMVPALFQRADSDDRATLQHGGGLIGAWARLSHDLMRHKYR